MVKTAMPPVPLERSISHHKVRTLAAGSRAASAAGTLKTLTCHDRSCHDMSSLIVCPRACRSLLDPPCCIVEGCVAVSLHAEPWPAGGARAVEIV